MKFKLIGEASACLEIENPDHWIICTHGRLEHFPSLLGGRA
jgi:hypothetical protein